MSIRKRKPALDTVTLSTRIEVRHAGVVDYTEHLRLIDDPNNSKLRIRIHVDTHAPQAYGVAEYWSSNGWTPIVHMAGESLATNLNIGYNSVRPSHVAFTGDRGELLTLACEILAIAHYLVTGQY